MAGSEAHLVARRLGRLTSIASAVGRELRAIPGSPVELGARLATLDRQLPGEPWARWLLLALYRHEARQAWVGEVVRKRLGGELQEIGRSGGFGHPDRDQRGEVQTPEAQTILALLRGHAPVNGPDPIGEPVEWEGAVKRVYRMDEVMLAQVGDFTAECFDRMRKRYGPVARRWLAS